MASLFKCSSLKANNGNETCSDCSTNPSSWVSFVATPEGRPIHDKTPFISFICEECSVIHKSIKKAHKGRIIEKIMLYSKDCKLKKHELKRIESSGGNERLNKVFEKTLVNRKNTGNVSPEDRAFFIVQKYVLGAYIEMLPSDPALIGQVQKLFLFLSISEFLNESKKLITSEETQHLKETLKHAIYNESGEANAALPTVISQLALKASQSDYLANKTRAHLKDAMEGATEANFAKSFEFLVTNDKFESLIEPLKVYTMFFCKGVTKLYESILTTAIQNPDLLEGAFGFVYDMCNNVADIFDGTVVEDLLNITTEAAFGVTDIITDIIGIGPIGLCLGTYMTCRGALGLVKGAAKGSEGMAKYAAGYVTGNSILEKKGKNKCQEAKNRMAEGTCLATGGITRATSSSIPGASLLTAVPVSMANTQADKLNHERKRNHMLGIVDKFAISVPLGTIVAIKETDENGIIIQYDHTKSKYSVMVYGTKKDGIGSAVIELRECEFKDFVQCLQVVVNKAGNMRGCRGTIKGWKSSYNSKQYIIRMEDLDSNETVQYIQNDDVIFDEGTVVRIVNHLGQKGIGVIVDKDLKSKKYHVRTSTNQKLECKFAEARV
jgi:hypothetical protein